MRLPHRDDPDPRVMVLGRAVRSYGERATRLRDESCWSRRTGLNPKPGNAVNCVPLSEGEKGCHANPGEPSLANRRLQDVKETLIDQSEGCAARDVEDLLPHLERRATELTERAKRKLESDAAKREPLT
jgi:hypothetical protein